MKTFAVTGAAGFIGFHLTRSLLGAGHAVIGVDNLTPYYDPELKRANLNTLGQSTRFRFCPIDLASPDQTSSLPPADHVIHLAGQPGVRQSWSDLQAYTDHNIVALGNLLQHYADRPPDRIVIASSSSVYGNKPTGQPTTEDHPLRPFSPYGVTKAAAEDIAHAYIANHQLPITILRYFTVYGPRQRPDMLIAKLIKATTDGPTVRIYGEGTAQRDFTYVDDVAAATTAAATTDLPPGTTINIASSQPVTVNTVIETIADLAGRRPRTERSEPATGDVNHTWASIENAKHLLGWEPQTTLRQGLANQITAATEADQTPRTEQDQPSCDT